MHIRRLSCSARSRVCRRLPPGRPHTGGSVPTQRWDCSSRPGLARRGLAPLELVLVIPLLMMVMALMINFAHQVAWKVQAQTASRQAVWRQRPTHLAGSRDRPPRNWEPPASMSVGGVTPPPLFPQDPYDNYSALRGPLLRDPQVGSPTAQLQVDRGLLSLNDDLVQGQASINREVVLLPRLYQIAFDVKHPLLQSEWRFHDLGYGSNNDRRTLKLYSYLPHPEVTKRGIDTQTAFLNVIRAPFRPALAILDKDQELATWFGSAPDFHPQAGRPCVIDRDFVYRTVVQPLIDRIQGPKGGGRGGVPEHMAQTFIRMYREQIAELQLQVPPPKAEIQALQDKIDELNRFIGTLY